VGRDPPHGAEGVTVTSAEYDVVDDAGRRSRSKSGTEDPGRRAGSKGPNEERKGIEAETAGLEGTRVVVDLSPASVNAVKDVPHYNTICCGSRLRAFALAGDLLAADPWFAYQPAGMSAAPA